MPRDYVPSDWLPAKKGDKVRFTKQGGTVLIERSDGVKWEVTLADFDSIVGTINLACVKCCGGVLSYLDVGDSTQLRSVCDSCEAAYIVVNGELVCVADPFSEVP